MLAGNYGNSQKNWHLLLPESLLPIRKEGMAGQRGNDFRPGGGVGGQGRRTPDRTTHWTGRYIQDVDHAATHVQAEAFALKVTDCEGGKRQEQEKW